VEISKERLLHNYRVLVRSAGAETTLLAVIKANAYGHGVERCARVLAEGGVEWLGVTGV
jgi:alanine racemase